MENTLTEKIQEYTSELIKIKEFYKYQEEKLYKKDNETESPNLYSYSQNNNPETR